MSNSITDHKLEEELEFDELSIDKINLNSVSIPLSANGWVTKSTENSPEIITEFGLANWMTSESVTSVYFHSSKSGQIELSLRCKVPDGKSRLKLSIDKTRFKVDVNGDHYQVIKVGKFPIENSGYVKVDMRGVNKTGGFYADVSHLDLSGDLVDNQSISFIREEPNEDLGWSRNGPSVHLSYQLPTNKQIEYYYNEVTVPEGHDPIHSYFMAIGFQFGYFGIQVNSESERRILFSVWSPFNTDNPNEIPEELKVNLVSKGTDVYVGEFGYEGSGAQSYLRYNWSPGITYKFLVRAKPDSNGSKNTVLSAWFAELDNDWKLIASFRRPKTQEYLSGFYSFVESFGQNYSFLCRKALFGNQWICDTTGKWHEVTNARFTGDPTADKKVRMDFEGGVQKLDQNQSLFYLRNCGFISGKVPLLSQFKRTENKIEPNINFNELPLF